MRLVEFHRYLDDNNALRVKFELEQGQVMKFAVQLECRFTDGGELSPVVRYDTAHGFAHCDRLYPHQKSAKTTMATQNYNEALTIAINDLVSNWSEYRRSFEEWLRQKQTPKKKL